MHEHIIGWDIGGAHLKAAVIDAQGVITLVVQLPCPLWKGMEELKKALEAVVEKIPIKSALHAITMTGELVDLFASREQGVNAIVQIMQQQFGGENIKIFAGSNGFLTPQQLHTETVDSVASANWLASATFVAEKINNGLFIDVGSTTTDILPICHSVVASQGLTDYERLVSEELVYTGIVRTPVMAICQYVDFKGNQVGLMAEYFATMADVFRLTGELNEANDLSDTADGAAKTFSASARRLARMIGCDYVDQEKQTWLQLANNIRSKQLTRIRQACEKQLSRTTLSAEDCFIGAGVGRFLVKQLANQLGHPYIDFDMLFNCSFNDSKISIADCVPAVSVGCLARASQCLN
jgi:probable H4MPT-linked C1 transfer pathway protein